jgi:hypothetical protein
LEDCPSISKQPMSDTLHRSLPVILLSSMISLHGCGTGFSDLPGSPTAETEAASDVTLTSGTLNGQVNPNGDEAEAWFEWGLDETYGNESDTKSLGSATQKIPVSHRLENGLTPNTVYHYRVVAQNGMGLVYGADRTFTTQPIQPPIVTTTAPSAISQTGCTFNATVNPNGSATTGWFEWGTNTNYGTTTAQQSLGNGTADVGLTQPISGLTPDLSYHYRAVAQNEAGVAYGADQVCITLAVTVEPGQLPVVTTTPPSVITQTGCTLNGTVNPNGSATTGWFEWGTDTNYGTTTAQQSLGNGTADAALSQAVSGLQSDTTYHYRAAAQNDAGVAFGSDQACATLPMTANPPTVTTELATDITQTAASLQGTINPNGQDAFGRFEWGMTTAYGNVTTEQYLGNGLSAVSFSFDLSGLLPDTEYHYRTIGRGDGEATGKDQIFRTLPVPEGPGFSGLFFDGMNDYVEVSHSDSLKFRKEMTIEARVFISDYEATRTIVSKNYSNSPANYELVILGDSGQLRFRQEMWDGSDIESADHTTFTSTAPVPTGQLVPVAVVVNTSSLQFYINGVQAGSFALPYGSQTEATAWSTALHNVPVRIGKIEEYGGLNAPYYFGGDMDEVRIWNGARTAAAILADKDAELTGTEANLRAYWKFNEGSGATANDSTVNGNHGTVYGGATFFGP